MASATFDIDKYLNPIVPRSRLSRLPRPISHFLGYRTPSASPQKPVHILLIWAWCFVGAFCGVAIIEVVYLHLPRLDGHQVPLVIASFGAAAILEYNTIESPLAQPRNLVFGHFLAALVGVSITKLFLLLPQAQFEQLRWLAGALAVGAASVVMSFTKTVHPPAGATALLTATSVDITELGWWLLPLVLLGCMLMLTSALILNNINRRFPMYWWTPVDLAALRDKDKTANIEKASDAIKQDFKTAKRSQGSSDSETDRGSEKPKLDIAQSDKRSVGDELRLSLSREQEIFISADRVVVPDWLQVNEWEMNVLQIFQQRLSSGAPKAQTS